MGIIKSTLNSAKHGKLWKDYLSARDKIQKEIAEAHLIKAMAADKGLSMKLGQIISSKNLDSKLYETVQTSSVQYSLEELFEAQLKQGHPDLQKVFSNIQPEAYTASLGQVHRGSLLDGEDVAVKFLYPGMDSEIKNQLKLLKALPSMGLVKKWNIPMEEYKQLFDGLLSSEIDYEKELHWNQKIYPIFEKHGQIHTPKVFPQFSNNSVIVQSWLEGISFKELCTMEKGLRRQAADLIFEFFIRLFFNHQILQTDIHPGNFKFKVEANQVQLMAFDFGAIQLIKEKQSSALLQFIASVAASSLNDGINLFIHLGFDTQKIIHLERQCSELARVLGEPFRDAHRFEVKDWCISKKCQLILGYNQWWFRSAGPPQLLMFMKAFQGLCSLLNSLNVGVAFKTQLETHCQEVLKKALSEPIPEYTVPRIPLSALAQNLTIKVFENQQQKVSLALPIGCIYDLESVLEPEVKRKIFDSGVDLNKVIQDFFDQGGLPGPIFKWESEGKSILVTAA